MADRKPVLLTAEGQVRLEQELAYLKTEKRAQIAEEMGRALAEGDLRENSGYDEARRNMWQNDARIAELEDLLARVQVVVHGAGQAKEVTLGVSVGLEDPNGTRKDYLIVGSHESDIFKLKISSESPFGVALMGKKVGEKVEVKGPKGSQIFTVVELAYA